MHRSDQQVVGRERAHAGRHDRETHARHDRRRAQTTRPVELAGAPAKRESPGAEEPVDHDADNEEVPLAKGQHDDHREDQHVTQRSADARYLRRSHRRCGEVQRARKRSSDVGS